MWDIQIQPEVIRSFKRLTKDSRKTLFLFLNDYLPKDLTRAKLKQAKIKELKGIHLFPKETDQGMIHLFTQIDFTTRSIKVLHLAIRNNSYDKARRKLLKRKAKNVKPE